MQNKFCSFTSWLSENGQFSSKCNSLPDLKIPDLAMVICVGNSPEFCFGSLGAPDPATNAPVFRTQRDLAFPSGKRSSSQFPNREVRFSTNIRISLKFLAMNPSPWERDSRLKGAPGMMNHCEG